MQTENSSDTAAPLTPQAQALADDLSQSLGAESVITEVAARVLHGQDVSGASEPVQMVVRPKNTAELAEIVKRVVAQDMVIVPRGGGMSYSSGYVCEGRNVVCLDTSAMSEILEINTEDMYVTVQAGCNWQKLHEALEPLGVRTPFWGTLSGIKATVGGGLSQNSIFWGSGRHGSAADSVVGFEIVLANGEILHTGAGAQRNGSPFFRHYGPDLTGLFTCDNGAMGIKATVTLKLLPAGEGRAYVSYDFAQHADVISALSKVSRANLADACFAFDPNMQAQRMKRESLLKDVKSLGNVIKSQGSVLRGIKEGVKVAAAGRGYMKDVQYSAHFMIDEANQDAADAAAKEIHAICTSCSGSEIENSIPKIARANPFGPLNAMIGPAGERWLPVHGLIPHSKALETFEAIEAKFAENAELMEKLAITHGYLLTYIDTNCFVIEPVFYWQDSLNELHRDTVEDAILSKLNAFPENLAARNEVMRICHEIIEIFDERGAAHLQIGRRYHFQEGLEPAPIELLGHLKKYLDPDGRVNPGALGY